MILRGSLLDEETPCIGLVLRSLPDKAGFFRTDSTEFVADTARYVTRRECKAKCASGEM